MKPAMAPCGIDCGECAVYRAAFDARQAALLVPWFKRSGGLKAGEGAAEIMAKAPLCMGCGEGHMARWCGNCSIRLCCTGEKGLAHCGECADFPCARLDDWVLLGEHHAAALETLKAVRTRKE